MTMKLDSIEMQDAGRKFTEDHIYANVGELVEYILKRTDEDHEAPFTWDDFNVYVDPSEWEDVKVKAYIEDELGATWEDATGVEWQTESDTSREDDDEFTPMDLRDDFATQMDMARDYIRDNATPKTIYEWYIVSQWLFERLQEEEAIVYASGGGLFIWGRQCCGQAIYMDYNIQRIINAWVEMQTKREERQAKYASAQAA